MQSSFGREQWRGWARLGNLLANHARIVVKPAYRFGSQQADRLGAVGDLRRNSASCEADSHSPIDLPIAGSYRAALRFVQI